MNVFKLYLGILSVLIILASGTLGALAIWGIHPVSWTLIWKIVLCVLIASVTITLLWQAVTVYFKKEKYSSEGNKAHRM